MVMAWASLKMHDWGKHRLYLIATFVLAAVFLVNKYFEYAAHFASGELPSHEHLPGDLLHAHRAARHPHPRRHGGDGRISSGRARSCTRRTPSSSPTASSTPGSTGTSSTWSGSSCSRCCTCCRESRHAFRSGSRCQQERSQLHASVFVVADGVHRDHGGGRRGCTSAVPIAITVALIIATMKGSMVAGVFMHLSHESKWIYGALILTVLGFVILMLVPMPDDERQHRHADSRRGAGRRARGALICRCACFTWCSSACRWCWPRSSRPGRCSSTRRRTRSATR